MSRDQRLARCLGKLGALLLSPLYALFGAWVAGGWLADRWGQWRKARSVPAVSGVLQRKVCSMSYSFTVAGADKADAKSKLAAQFDGVIAGQAVHAADRAAALAAGGAFIDLLVDPTEGQEIEVSLHGSLGWRDEAQSEFTGAGVGVSARIRDKQ